MKTFFNTIGILLFMLVLGLSSCERECHRDECIDESLIRHDVMYKFTYNPVCGCDGKTYNSPGEAKYKHGVTKYTMGPCEVVEETEKCVDPKLIDLKRPIPKIFQPVCGCDGVNYGNPYEAMYRGGVTQYTEGKCNEGQILLSDSIKWIQGPDFDLNK